ncbi:MAG: 50S ribosomal protein L9 [Thermoanaerobaculia bacterium]
MKIILTDEVRGLGHRGDQVDVKNGYARNFLLPQGLAFLATQANKRRLEEEKKSYDAKVLREKAVSEEVGRKMEGLRLTLVKKAGEGDVLYGSVTAGDIADALAEKGIQVDRRRVELEEPIKRLGEHQVHVKLHRDVTVPVIIEVQGLQTAAS